MTTYMLGIDTRIVILTREKHYQLEHAIQVTIDYDDDHIHVFGQMESLPMATPTSIEIRQAVTDDPLCLLHLIQTEPIFHNIFDSYSYDIGIEDVGVVEATMQLHGGELHFFKDDIGYVLQIDLRETPTLYTTPFEENMELPNWVGDTQELPITIDTDVLVGTTYAQPDGTPEWLLKQMDIPFPFELYEFDYDFCAWCGMVKEKTTKHIDCALSAATEMFLRDMRNNIRELAKVVKHGKPIDVTIWAIPEYLNSMSEEELVQFAEHIGVTVKEHIEDNSLMEKMINES